MSPTVWGISSAGVVCNPRIVGPGKWLKPAKGDPLPGMERLEIRFVRPSLHVVQGERLLISMTLGADEYPLIGFRGCDMRLRAPDAVVAEPVAAVAVAVAAATASVTASPPVTPGHASPFVASLVTHIKSAGISHVLESLITAQQPKDVTTPLEKELQVALLKIGSEGVATAIADAQKLCI